MSRKRLELGSSNFDIYEDLAEHVSRQLQVDSCKQRRIKAIALWEVLLVK